jgi:hypothetical protein
METPSFETTTQVFVGNHSMNIHIMSRLVSICQVLSEEEIQSKSSQTRMPSESNMSHDLYILHSELSYT